MMVDPGRTVRKSEVAQTERGAAANAGFGASDLSTLNLASAYDKPSPGYYTILPGQSWETVVPQTMPTKSFFAPVPNLSTTTPTEAKAIPKPAPMAASGWVEVNSAEGWNLPSSTTPTTPTKQRKQTGEPASPPHLTSTSPQSYNSSPNAQGNGKRHHDIEDELGHQDRYKTELCRSWHDSGTCRYGSKCQFAHGAHELRPVMRHPKYKTEPCRSWMDTRTCPYGRRCRFIHADPPHHHQQQQQQQQQQQSQQRESAQSMQNGVPFSPAAPATAATTTTTTTSPVDSQSSYPTPIMERSMSTESMIRMQQQQQQMQMNAASARPIVPPSHMIAPAYVPQMQYAYPGSPPYNGFGFATSAAFGGSAPVPINSREAVAIARANNSPWVYDTYVEDEADDDENDLFSDALHMTPLIEQLNLHAEPVSPTLQQRKSQPNTSSGTVPTHRPAPIGSAPNGSRAAAPVGTASATATTASNGTESTDGAEKSKKKKRLNIFQRITSK